MNGQVAAKEPSSVSFNRPPPAPIEARAATALPPLSAADARLFADMAFRHAGLNLRVDRPDFLRTRLARRMKAHGATDFGAYARRLTAPGAGEEIRLFVEALTTHTTSFFREQAHYDWLESDGLPTLIDNGAGLAQPLRIWSAACSTGQELYSALMLATELCERLQPGLRVEGLGTDISRSILARAKNAVFPPMEIVGLDEARRRRFLLRSKQGPTRYRIARELRRKTEWRPLNITSASVESMPQADIIFLRNVLIYFDSETQAQVIEQLGRQLRPGGYLLTGHSEGAPGAPAWLRPIKASVFQRLSDAP